MAVIRVAEMAGNADSGRGGTVGGSIGTLFVA
jgi:hypothetical protein